MTVSTPVRQHIGILDAQGVSWRRMAREVGVSRRPVGRYAELEDCSPKPPEHAKAKSKPDPFKPVIDKWLESDRLMPRRQRHTAMRVWRRPRDEHGHGGSYRLVQRYVRQRKRGWGIRATVSWNCDGSRASRRSISAKAWPASGEPG